MTRYLIVITLAVLAACSFSSVAQRDTPAAADISSDRIRMSAINGSGDIIAPGPKFGLTAFTRHASVTDGERARAGGFEVLYHAPNRHADVAAPYQPVSVPDRVMILRRGQVVIEEAIPAEFAGTAGTRSMDVAQLNVGDRQYLLVTTSNEARNPLWVALYSADGKRLYRASLEHGSYRFVEHTDGISMLDQAGQGKRITLL